MWKYFVQNRETKEILPESFEETAIGKLQARAYGEANCPNGFYLLCQPESNVSETLDMIRGSDWNNCE